METAPLTDFEARWLAEAIRLRELEQGSVDDTQAVEVARHDARGLEPRLVARAYWLGARNGMREEVLAWRSQTRLATGVVLVLAFVLGIGAALTVAGDGTRPINVVWALGGLLGVHLLSLAIWLAGVFVPGTPGGGWAGRAWLWLARRVAPGGRGAYPARALAGLYRSARLMRWGLSAITHGVWSVALSGALVGLLVVLSLRSYGFVWETTILSADVFVRFVELSGWLPAQLGFVTPDPTTVSASGAVALMDDASRHAWSSWLVGCLIVYGIVPRLLLWAGCTALFRTRRKAIRLDPELPGYAALVHRLMPASERMGVTDAAPKAVQGAHIREGRADAKGPPVLATLELHGGGDWPPPLPPTARYLGRLDTREERARVAGEIAKTPPVRLLIACDPRLSPDRGSLGLIADLACDAGKVGVWLVSPTKGGDAERLGYWHEGLETLGVRAERVFDARESALNWLGGGDAH